MIEDDGHLLVASAPASGVFEASTFGIDLNPDFGTGASARQSPIPGAGGEEIMFRVSVTTAFAVGAGEPGAQFHAVLSDLGDGVAVHTGASVISIGVQSARVFLNTADVWSGYQAADLPVNTHFFIRFNPWTSGMGRNFADAVVIGKNLRYLGVAITVPNYDGGTHAFSAGSISAVLVKSSDVLQNPEDFAFPAGMVVTG